MKPEVIVTYWIIALCLAVIFFSVALYREAKKEMKRIKEREKMYNGFN